jgi:hypothetical protein
VLSSSLFFLSLLLHLSCRSRLTKDWYCSVTTMAATPSQDMARDSLGMSQPLMPILERLVEAQVKHAQILNKQEEHLAALREQREIQLRLDPNYIQFEESRQRRREIKGQWHDEILKWDPLMNWPADEDRSLYEIVSAEQLWTSWQYRAAYPNTAKFLAKATSAEKSRSTVSCHSFLQNGKMVEKWSSDDPYAKLPGRRRISMPERMWDIVKRRILVDRIGEFGPVGERLPSRLLCVVDISPVIAAILLASTPK